MIFCLFFFHEKIKKRKTNSTIEQQKFKGQEKRDRLLISKVDFNFQISQRIKNLPIDTVFSNGLS